MQPIVAILGRANVGKSTLFNRLVGRNQAITHNSPGTTRDTNFGDVSWNGRSFLLADTAGLEAGPVELEASIAEQIAETADSAALLVMAVDATTIITTEDRQAAKMILKTGKPAILVLTKADAAGRGVLEDFRRLGLGAPLLVSAIHGTGTGDLLDAIVAALPETVAPERRDVFASVALLGRPNVGKSSLLNSLIGKQKAVVSSLAGTTRDVSTATLTYHGKKLAISDTAGLRRRGKIEQGIEKYSSYRTLAAATNADICIVVLDATDPGTSQDLHIAGLVKEAGSGLILVVNKWDTVEKDDKTQARFLRRLEREFDFLSWAPVVFTSATQGLNVTKLFELVVQIAERRRTKLSTPELNTWLKRRLAAHPPAGLKNRHPKLNYMTQTSTNPPEFTIFGAKLDFLHWSYKRYLENELRSAHDFTGTGIRIIFRDKHKD